MLSRNINLSLLILLSFILKISSFDHFKIITKPNQKKCFTDDVFKDTFIRLDIKSDSSKVDIEFKNPGNDRLHISNANNFEKGFSSSEDGYIEFCIINTNTGDVITEIDYSTGLEAKDFGGLVKEKDIEPINKDIEEIEGMFVKIKNSIYNSEEIEGMYKTAKESLGNYTFRWFIVILIVILLISGVEFYYINQQLSVYKLK